MDYKHFKYDRSEMGIFLKKKKEQGYRCAYTNEPIVLGLNANLGRIPPIFRFPELEKGLDNVEWVSAKVHHKFIEFCQIISQLIV